MASPSKPNPSNIHRYSSLALQMLLSIGLSGWLGHLLDDYLQFSFPVFLLLFGFATFAGMMYQLYRSLNKE